MQFVKMQVPDELQGLNWIEKSIIQLSRPVRAVYCLNDAGGQKTSMLSTGGEFSCYLHWAIFDKTG